MKFIEAKEELKQGYIDSGFEITNEHEEEIILKFRSGKFKISKSDIEEYAEFNIQRSEFETQPCECSIVSRNYREQIISGLHSRVRMPLMHRTYYFGNQSGENIHAEIGGCSDTFLNFFRFQKQYTELNKDKLDFRVRHRIGGDDVELKECLYRPLTVKVFNLKETNVKAAVQKSTDIIESCIFALSSLKDCPIELLDEWPVSIWRRERKTSRDFEFRQIEHGTNIPLPKFKLDPALVRLYQQATSSEIPSLKYLSFYQILEFHFLSVADENLYYNLSRRINDLKFKTTPTHLDKLIQDVLNHKRENDETEMLKNVIKKYVDETDIIEFITEYEKFLEKKVYTTKRIIFGNEISAISLNVGHTYGCIAKIVKAIRNALVHSSDRYERNDRYIPYSKEGTDLLELEMPLIKFLADKIIVATSMHL